MPVGLVDLEFGVPLHAKAKMPPRIFDTLDDAIFGHRIDHDARSGVLYGLVMSTVHGQTLGAGDPMQKRPGDDADFMTRLAAGVWLAVR